jgi:hypothetical protein
MLGPLTLWRSLAEALLKRREDRIAVSFRRGAMRLSVSGPSRLTSGGSKRIMPVSGWGDQSLDYLSDAFYSFKLGETSGKGPATHGTIDRVLRVLHAVTCW